MKNVFAFVLLFGFFSSCATDEAPNLNDSKLLGTWQLTEILIDPGDGSGSFEMVQSEKILEFGSDGIVTSNGQINRASIESNMPSSLRFSKKESVIYTEGFASMKFELKDSVLVLNAPCIEACQSKYVKVR